MADQFITVREAAQALGISEKQIMDFIEGHKLQAYRIAGQFLRLKKSEVLELRNEGQVKQETTQFEYTLPERVRDFIYYNDFYILAIIIVITLLYIIFYL